MPQEPYTAEQLTTQLAENIAVLQHLMVLGLRSCQHVTWEELSKATSHLAGFHGLPADVRQEVMRIRDERFNIR